MNTLPAINADEIRAEYADRLNRIQAAAANALRSGKYIKAVKLCALHMITQAHRDRMEHAIDAAAGYIYR